MSETGSRRAIAVIPARLASTRLAEKVLLNRTGKALVQHVWEATRRARSIERVLIATDDDRVAAAARAFGAECVLTRADHPNGTSRVAEVAEKIDGDVFLSVQGDEPGTRPDMIDALVGAMAGADMATLACPFADEAEKVLPSRVKVTIGPGDWAIDFSRTNPPLGGAGRTALHLGFYAFTRETLRRVVGLPPTKREKLESLEQLRAHENGVRIKVALVDRPRYSAVDTPEDYERFVQAYSTETGGHD